MRRKIPLMLSKRKSKSGLLLLQLGGREQSHPYPHQRAGLFYFVLLCLVFLFFCVIFPSLPRSSPLPTEKITNNKSLLCQEILHPCSKQTLNQDNPPFHFPPLLLRSNPQKSTPLSSPSHLLGVEQIEQKT